MTCIVGVVQDGEVWLGCDSHLTIDGVIYPGEKKIFRCGPMLIAAAGTAAIGQVMRYRWAPPDTRGAKGLGYLAGRVMPSLREALTEEGQIVSDKDGIRFEGALIIAYRARLYHVDSAFCVSECSGGYTAVGSGCEPALGALHVTRGTDARQRAMLALAAAEAVRDTVHKPFHVVRL